MGTGDQQSEWARELQKLHPEQIWQHDDVLTEFQRWTLYRICTRTLNLYHEGWPEDRHCSYQECSTSTETIEHIVWERSRAQEVWQEWLPRWLGHYPHRDENTQLTSHFATRKAPLASPAFEKEASRTILYWEAEHDEALQVIWSIWTTCTQCTLWIIRNRFSIVKSLHDRKPNADS
ncbi:RxLR effector protein [Phytophthora megakarya]|uniref:RxLR effector protein n=1 Tax=Phytophthora megakarya TaxID=4795 RepID=A0A225UZI3_9STRA|nr:RxLR effector protein [Phytophthora megakarya]